MKFDDMTDEEFLEYMKNEKKNRKKEEKKRKKEEVNKINWDNVKSVYLGKMNTCCCGCAGTHHKDPTSRTFKRIKSKIKKAVEEGIKIEIIDAEVCVSINLNRRLYIAYFRD